MMFFVVRPAGLLATHHWDADVLFEIHFPDHPVEMVHFVSRKNFVVAPGMREVERKPTEVLYSIVRKRRRKENIPQIDIVGCWLLREKIFECPWREEIAVVLHDQHLFLARLLGPSDDLLVRLGDATERHHLIFDGRPKLNAEMLSGDLMIEKFAPVLAK